MDAAGKGSLVTLPRSWSKRFQSPALLEQVAQPQFWISVVPTMPAGRDILNAHEDLFQCLDRLEAEYRLALKETGSFMAVPLRVQNQGIALTQGRDATVEVSAFLYPSTFRSDKSEGGLFRSVHFPVARGKAGDMARLLPPLWPAPGEELTAVIPFSMESAVTLYGCFLDEEKKTRQRCFEAVKEGDEVGMQNCRIFLNSLVELGVWGR